MSNNANGFASNESGTRQQCARASPRDNLPATQSIPGLPDIPKELSGVPPDLAAVVFAAAGNQEPAIMEAVANTIKNRIGLNVYGLPNLNSYDDVIYQWTSGRILRDKNGRPLRDRYGNPRRQGDRPQFNEITGRQMERAYQALTPPEGKSEPLGASALRGPKDEDALTDAYKAADRVYHTKSRITRYLRREAAARYSFTTAAFLRQQILREGSRMVT